MTTWQRPPCCSIERQLLRRHRRRDDGDEGQVEHASEVGLAHRGGSGRRLDDRDALVDPAVAEPVEEQRARQPVLQRARRMGRLVLQVEVDAPGRRQRERHQVGVRRAPRVGFDARDGVERPPSVEGQRVGHVGPSSIRTAQVVRDGGDDKVLRSEQAFEHRAGKEVGVHRVLRPVRGERSHLPVERRRSRRRRSRSSPSGQSGCRRFRGMPRWVRRPRRHRGPWTGWAAPARARGRSRRRWAITWALRGRPDASPSSPTKQPAPCRGPVLHAAVLGARRRSRPCPTGCRGARSPVRPAR